MTLMAQDLFTTLEEMRRYLSTFEVDGRYRSERDEYLQAHLLRLKRTLEMVPPAKPGSRLLELGAAPYLMTCLLSRYTDYELFTTIFREGYPAELSVTMRNEQYNEEKTFVGQNFNVETDPFPYPDNFFDVVLCCELLEHLTLDPTHMLVEIHRILKPEGKLLITTPNVLVLRNLTAMIKKKNIYGPYSGYGVYGRHNREWTLDEVCQLCCGCGYGLELAVTVDTFPHRGYSAWLKRLFPHLRDMICVLAVAEGRPQHYYPENLYAALHARPHSPALDRA